MNGKLLCSENDDTEESSATIMLAKGFFIFCTLVTVNFTFPNIRTQLVKSTNL